MKRREYRGRNIVAVVVTVVTVDAVVVVDVV